MGLQTISLVGYTNAGKTSLFNVLTHKKNLVENALFATVEKILSPEVKKIIIKRYTNLMSWVTYALLSAIFAAFTAILTKIGIKNVDSNLATAIRTIVIVLFAWGIVFYQGTFKQLSSLSKYSLIFLILSGVATGLSWLFYFRALQLGKASQVAPIDKLSLVITIILAAVILKEKVTASIILGGVLMALGAILVGWGK